VLGRPVREQLLWTQSLPDLAAIPSVNEAPEALNAEKGIMANV